MLTGAASNARIATLTPTVIDELAKTDLAPILQLRPEVASELGRVLARWQSRNRAIIAPQDNIEETSPRLADWFAERLRTLFT
jgi:hypothetical protein